MTGFRMKINGKKTFFLIFLVITVQIFLIPTNTQATGDYLIDVGEAWTYTYNGKKYSLKITYISGSTILADRSKEGEITSDYSVGSADIKTTSMLNSYESGCDSKETKSYGGRSCYCYISYNIGSTDKLVLDSATGIVLEREDSYGTQLLTSWKWESGASSGIPEPAIIIIFGTIALATIVIVSFYLKKRKG